MHADRFGFLLMEEGREPPTGTWCHTREIKELSSPEVNSGASMFRVKRCSHCWKDCKIVSRYTVSMVVRCSPRLVSTRDINIEVPPELYWNHHATEKRPYQYNKLLLTKSLLLFYARLYWAFLDTSPSTIKNSWTYQSRLILRDLVPPNMI